MANKRDALVVLVPLANCSITVAIRPVRCAYAPHNHARGQMFVSLTVCLSMCLGHYEPVTMFVCAFAIIVFYSAHWGTYVTGTLKFDR
jgi:hypothetical protein